MRENGKNERLFFKIDSLKQIINNNKLSLEVLPFFETEKIDYADSVVEKIVEKRYSKSWKINDSVKVSYVRWDSYESKDSLVHFSIGLNLVYRFQTNENIIVDLVNQKVYELDPLSDSLILLDYWT